MISLYFPKGDIQGQLFNSNSYVKGVSGREAQYKKPYVELAYTLYRLRHVSDLVSAPAGHFMPMLRTSHTVLELMPDAPPTDDTDPTDSHEDPPNPAPQTPG